MARLLLQLNQLGMMARQLLGCEFFRKDNRVTDAGIYVMY